MSIRIIQWNISSGSNPTAIAEFLTDMIKEKTVVALQEVTQKHIHILVQNLMPQQYIYSLDMRQPGKNEGRNRKLGVAIFTFGVSIDSYNLLDRTIFPERTLFARIDIGSFTTGILNFHSLTGVGYKKAKTSNFAAIADFMEETSNQMDFACFDANEPEIDSFDENSVKFWDNKDKGFYASLILGKNRVHPLNDSLRTLLKNNGTTSVDTPLAVSYMAQNIPRRYDHIYHSEKWNVLNVQYPFSESIEASSDHSAVIGDFEFKI
ncbi:MAG TPA: hypothetical protein PK711_02430 [Bacteroidales bacterium]|nr:hypothetical protein [Bacteroidales bacterium]